MGIPLTQFDEPPDKLDFLQCTGCHLVVEAALFVCKAEHLACSSCQAQALLQKSCPTQPGPCTAALDVRSSTFVERQLDALKRRCLYYDKGCQWVGQRTTLIGHSNECELAPSQCECGLGTIRRELVRHRAESCPLVTVKCEREGCIVEFPRKDKEEHDKRCDMFRCKYADKGCSGRGTQKFIEVHEASYCVPLHRELGELRTQVTGLVADLAEHRESCGSWKRDKAMLTCKLEEAQAQIKLMRAEKESGDQGSRAHSRKRRKSAPVSEGKEKKPKLEPMSSTAPASSSSRRNTSYMERSKLESSPEQDSSEEEEEESGDECSQLLRDLQAEDVGIAALKLQIARLKRELLEKDEERARALAEKDESIKELSDGLEDARSKLDKARDLLYKRQDGTRADAESPRAGAITSHNAANDSAGSAEAQRSVEPRNESESAARDPAAKEDVVTKNDTAEVPKDKSTPAPSSRTARSETSPLTPAPPTPTTPAVPATPNIKWEQTPASLGPRKPLNGTGEKANPYSLTTDDEACDSSDESLPDILEIVSSSKKKAPILDPPKREPDSPTNGSPALEHSPLSS